MEESYTVASFIVKQWFDTLVSMGIPIEELEDKIGIGYQQIQKIDGRIPIGQHYHLIDLGIKLTNDPALSLRIGRQNHPEGLGVIGRIFLTSPTLGEAGYHATKYSKLFSDSHHLEIREENKQVEIVFQNLFSKYDSISAIETTFAASIATCHALSSVEFTPQEIHFQYEPPTYVEEYYKIFNCPMYFRQPENKMIYSRELFDVPLPTHDPYMLELLTGHADSLLQAMLDTQNFKNHVSELILEYLPTGQLDIELIADQLNISRWTLNRKLREEETTFQELLQDTRHQMANNYLQKPGFSVSEVGFLLGFSEPSAFNRAYRRWSGRTPSEYRKSSLSNPGSYSVI